MKVSENKPHSIHLRLTQEQYEFLRQYAEILGIGVSECVRMLVNTSMYADKKIAERVQSQLGGPLDADHKNNFEHSV